MMHLEGRDAVVRHLQAKFQGNRKDPPEVGGWPESHPGAPHGPEPGQTPPVGSKGKLPPKPPQTRRVDYSRASPSHSTGQSVGQHSPPHPPQETLARMARRKQAMAEGANFHLAKPGEGGVLNKEVGTGSDAPQRKPARQTRPLTKDKGVPVVPAKGAAVAAPLVAVGSSHRTGPPDLPQRKPLPHISMLGVKPAKPWHPPVMDLAKFKAAAHPGTAIRPATEPPRNAQLGHLRPGRAGAAPVRLLLQDAPSGTGDEDEIYDDAESVGLPRRSPGLLLPPVSWPPVYPCPRRGGDAGQASNTVTLLAAAQREAQVSQKMKTMTLKECKKEEKADKEFQKKFKFEGSINVLTQMMVDPAATEKRGRGKNLPVRRGEILDVIQFTNEEQILCRNSQRRYGYMPRAVMLHLDTDIYDDVEIYG
ncbi:PML-RARA-regulated adapter molecule 1 [Pithys albifrons albifrons]|uniref:PML-RARA-regulated adapter molecule 1 n=1 Tax=Pithys albifrons albifrons TaxID=3385563 RepID=UPI003A5CD2BC